ncbi:MAG: phage antirepressor N-terminal domain-containing protein [Candidatus Omnitrophica bacterium]|nr:phage antirepressor N-terminal domain-containing protein [Candidatus Omnitrophota bacterium]
MDQKIMTVEFYGDQLQVVGNTLEDAVLLLKPACEALGIDAEGQRQRLKTAPWAGACVTQAPDARGRAQEHFAIPIKKVPMWLATIDASRLANEQARVKLVRYQCEAADVLARHFMGAPKASAGPDPRILEAHLLSESMKNWTEFYDRLGLLDSRRQFALADMGELAFRRGQRALGGGSERKLLPKVGSSTVPVGTVSDEDRTTAEMMYETGRLEPAEVSDWSSSAGRWLAAACRRRYGADWEFDKTLQRIDNVGRPVNVFAAKDVAWLRAELDRYILTLPERKARKARRKS